MNMTTTPAISNPNRISDIEELELGELDLGELDLPSVETLESGTTPASDANAMAVAIDMTGFSSKQVEIVRNATATIRQHDRSVREAIVAIGNELLVVKDLLGHGKFGPWLKAEFDWSERTAENYMNVARAFAGAPAVAAQFSASIAYKIAAKSTPAPVRAAIIEDAASGKTPTATEVVERIEAGKVKAGTAVAKAAVAAKQEDAGNVVTGPAVVPTTPPAASAKIVQVKQGEKKKQEAISRMVAMLQRQLGDDFAGFQTFMAKVDPTDFADAVKKATPLAVAVKEAA